MANSVLRGGLCKRFKKRERHWWLVMKEWRCTWSTCVTEVLAGTKLLGLSNPTGRRDRVWFNWPKSHVHAYDHKCFHLNRSINPIHATSPSLLLKEKYILPASNIWSLRTLVYLAPREPESNEANTPAVALGDIIPSFFTSRENWRIGIMNYLNTAQDVHPWISWLRLYLTRWVWKWTGQRDLK